MLGAESKALAREKQIYQELLQYLSRFVKTLQTTAEAAAELDVLNNLAKQADLHHYHRPIWQEQTGIQIQSGRHPVLERLTPTPFVPNDLLLNTERRTLLITGPNMGGKSTYMRQVALIALMAHIGSFVPAQKAVFGPLDRLFTRIGAQDDLSMHQSTFMVEMTETAQILRHATNQSLVLLDEIGRGTSTYDGLSLAWATTEALTEETKALTLFSTHYFELTRLAEQLDKADNVHFGAQKEKDQLIFLHQVQPGAASQSYGIEVAQLAGIPAQVIAKARRKLAELESMADAKSPPTPVLQREEELPPQHPFVKMLQELDVNDLSPKAALALMYEWHALTCLK